MLEPQILQTVLLPPLKVLYVMDVVVTHVLVDAEVVVLVVAANVAAVRSGARVIVVLIVQDVVVRHVQMVVYQPIVGVQTYRVVAPAMEHALLRIIKKPAAVIHHHAALVVVVVIINVVLDVQMLALGVVIIVLLAAIQHVKLTAVLDVEEIV